MKEAAEKQPPPEPKMSLAEALKKAKELKEAAEKPPEPKMSLAEALNKAKEMKEAAVKAAMKPAPVPNK